MQLTAEQIVALAPDDSSVKAGRSLANPAKWPVLGQSPDALWGECQGSGNKPYQVSVDLTGAAAPAFKCTCPSRKFPCKHGLGLMLLAVEKPAAVKADAAPPWVADWLASRRGKAEKKAASSREKIEAPPDPEAAAKRAAKRLDRMKEGGEELARWLADQVRNGIAAYPQQPASYFMSVAARMVDAQAPGLGNEVSRLEALIHTGDGWPRRVLAQLGRMYLLVEGLRRFDSLPPPMQADLRSCLGWYMDKDEVLGGQPRVKDEWSVVGQSFAERERLWERRTWLLGRATGKAALVLEFGHGHRGFSTPLSAGTCFEASLAYFPSAFPLRALLADGPANTRALDGPFSAHADFSSAFDAYAGAVAANPWLLNAPTAVADTTPLRRGATWFLRDAAGAELPLRLGELEKWELLAESSGRPVRIFGEFSGGGLRVLSFWTERFHAFVTTTTA